MKTIYILIIFLIFFNVFSFMFGYFGVFPYEGGTDDSQTLNPSGDIDDADSYLKNVGGGISTSNIFSMFFGDIDSLANVIGSILLLGGAIGASYLTRSPAPFVVAFIGNFVRVSFQNSMGVIEQYPINSYLMFAFGIGMILLLIITAAEYLTHGDV